MKPMSDAIRQCITAHGWQYMVTWEGWVNVRSDFGEVNFLRVNNITYKFGRTNWRYLKSPELIDALEEYL